MYLFVLTRLYRSPEVIDTCNEEAIWISILIYCMFHYTYWPINTFEKAC